MCLCSHSGVIRLVLMLISFSIAGNVYAASIWSSVGNIYFKKDLNRDENRGLKSTNCDISKLAGKKEVDGDPMAPRQDMQVKMNGDSVIVNYGDGEKAFVGDGTFRYAEKREFNSNLHSKYKSPLVQALKTALEKDNCDIADTLMDALQNGKPQQTEDGQGELLGFNHGQDKCAITSSGETRCKWSGAAEQCDSNGQNCRIIIGNDKTGSLQDYAASKERKTENNQSSGGSGTINEHRGDSAGSGSTGSGSGNAGGSSSSGGQSDGKNEGSQGNKLGKNGVGNGTGNGQGDGEGDGNAKVNTPKLEDIDLKKAFMLMKKKLDGIIPEGLSVPSGSCPRFTVPVLGRTYSIETHCQILDKNGGKLSAVFMLIWGFIALRILLSA